ncbi:MAG TPA: AAA family ATPase [Candidatus Limnocylindrales bacterium]|nr:AAA family ATPase [Candidatus Limnocylindrales bacterium]
MIATPQSTAQTSLDWLDANQRFLAAQMKRIGAALDVALRLPGSEETRIAAEDAVEEVRNLIDDPALDRIGRLFGLTAFERDTLLLCAAIELDAAIARRCVDLTGGPWATFGLALATFPAAHWSALLPDAPLRSYRLLEPRPGQSLVMAPLQIAESIVHGLAGLEVLDPTVAPVVNRARPVPIAASRHIAVAEDISRAIGDSTVFRYQLVGDDPDGQRDVAVRAAARCGRSLWLLPASEIPADAPGRQAMASRWARDAALLGATLLVTDADERADVAIDFVTRAAAVVGVAVRHPIALPTGPTWKVHLPEPMERRDLWRQALPADVLDDASLQVASSQFRMSADAISRAARRILAGQGGAAAPLRTIRPTAGAEGLGEIATWLEPRATWNQLILPEEQVEILREIVDQVRGRTTVHEAWGFRSRAGDGLGIAALFEGDSGTGKSLAAEVVASALDLPVLRVDLANVVSKYIGETERNLGRIFLLAEGTGAVILFDEAEALFGKRSDVKDSHDRYANIEVAYLLQRVEAYRGLAILTSNAKSSIDRAFLRRLRFIVRFPFPDEAHREQIWRVAFPSTTPTRGLDFRRLARLPLAGGDIRNIALGAAFRAAAAGEPVRMTHLRAAAKRELEKLGRMPTDADTASLQ